MCTIFSAIKHRVAQQKMNTHRFFSGQAHDAAWEDEGGDGGRWIESSSFESEEWGRSILPLNHIPLVKRIFCVMVQI